MTPEEESTPPVEPPQTTGSAEGLRSGRRSRRGHRGRGRRRKPTSTQGESPVARVESEAAPETSDADRESFDSTEAAAEASSESVEPQASHPAPAVYLESVPERPAIPGSIQDAIDHVTHVIAALRGAVDEMEDVLELLESLERQTGADEREIESLRRALRQLQRPREAGQHQGRR